MSAQAVSWWSVHEFVQRFLDTAGDYPMCGTPAWCLLPDDSREKWAALLDFAQHHALRVETGQEAHAQASHAISEAAGWDRIAREIQQRNNFRKEHPWARREARP